MPFVGRKIFKASRMSQFSKNCLSAIAASLYVEAFWQQGCLSRYVAASAGIISCYSSAAGRSSSSVIVVLRQASDITIVVGP
jgi:hypothetical protein